MCLPWKIIIGLFLSEDASGSSADTTLSTKIISTKWLHMNSKPKLIIKKTKTLQSTVYTVNSTTCCCVAGIKHRSLRSCQVNKTYISGCAA